ncbi:hypothetical protein DFR79_101203 [Halanaerobium saccharolyticum]|uniref:Flagellar hook-associated protein 2 C-terminal domain-containing protein n=1 Tax=Halanaerobium saccharolyticum TaxID=43595 RepID=A0A4V3CFU4_9FIRM|nr:flagellar filament capping protein FliD [Halanaerobium saccharolyticum]TDO95202.1 hypothetical protein DFR79_101203 [Halanaerobium saccharolyticum]
MINGLNSTSFYNTLNNYSLYNTTDENLFTNPYTNLQSEISNPVETGDLFSEDQSLFNITDFEAASVLEMQESLESFETSITNLEADITGLRNAVGGGSGEEIVENTENFIVSYNKTLENLRENGNYNSLEAAEDLVDKAEVYENQLNSIGIEVGSSGELSLNQEELAETLANKPTDINSVLNSETGFLDQVAEEVNDLESEAPASYLNFGSGLGLYTANDTAENMLENGLIVDLYT